MRVSSKEQYLEQQTNALDKEKVVCIFTDMVSGSSANYSGLDNALSYLRPGGWLIGTNMDRTARSLIDLLRLVDNPTARDISVKFEVGQIYSLSSTPITKIVLGLLSSVAEFE